MLFFTFVLYGIALEIENIVAGKQKHAVTKQEAGEVCSKTGTTLVDYMYIKGHANSFEPKYLEQLENGGSAWVDGYAELSPFVEWEGCYTVSGLDFKHRFITAHSSLFLCLTGCLHGRNAWYIGMQGKTCFCFTKSFLNYQPANQTHCSIPCDDNGVDSCGGDLYADLYRVNASMSLRLKPPSKQQCVYLDASKPVFSWYTASCHGFTADGYLCDELAPTFKTRDCNATINQDGVRTCLKTVPSTRHEAYKACQSLDGRLSPLSSAYAIKRDTTYWSYSKTAKSKFWLSTYRAFRASANMTNSETACLAAVKLNNVLYLEPDDCSVKKEPLCRPNLFSSANSSVSSVFVTKRQTQNITVTSTALSIHVTVRSLSRALTRAAVGTYCISYIAFPFFFYICFIS